MSGTTTPAIPSTPRTSTAQSNVASLLGEPDHPVEVGGLREIQAIVPFSKSKIYDLMKHGGSGFPRPFRLNCANRVLWDLHRVRSWLAAQVAEVQSRAGDAAVKAG